MDTTNALDPSEVKTPVQFLWEEMNKGVPNTTFKSTTNKYISSRNETSERRSNNWITYLGLEPSQEKQTLSSIVENGSGSVSKSVAAMWEEMNQGRPNMRCKSYSGHPSSTVGGKTTEKVSENWKMYLGLEAKKIGSLEQGVPQKEPVQNGTSEQAKKLAAAALSAVKDASVAALGKGKIEIAEVRDFAGQEIEYKKLVDADSKEAIEKVKASAPSAVDAILEQIKKKPKLSVLDKTKKDWGEFKEENRGLEDELDAYKKSSNQYLDKVSFLQRTDFREFERERDARLAALQGRRRSDMCEEP